MEPRPHLEGTVDADVVVIGGGYTGMWAAWHLLEAGAEVALLEGDVCGHGPSGRNGGFCESLWFGGQSLRERFGDEPALRLLEASSESVGLIGDWCRDQNVDAWFDQSGYLCVSTGAAFDLVGQRAVEAARALGVPERAVALSGEETRARCGSPLFRRATFISDFATVQPARLALGLRARLAERGVRLFEHSRARSVRAAGGSAVVVETEGGRVRAGAAVLATGGAARSVPELRSRLTVASSHIVLTEPVSDVIEELGWTGGECITDGRALLHYFRTTRDGRIALGWGGGRLAYGSRLHGRVEVDPQAAAGAHAELVRLFPALASRRVTHAWGGPIDVSPSHIPQVGTLSSAPVHYAFGYTGNGVGPSHLAGRTLASLALGRSDALTRLPIVNSPAGAWVPPEPLAWLGGSLVRAAVMRSEAALARGARPGPITRAICAVPKAMGIHLAR